ncbi:hypothetical protein HYR99_22650 [Candidatus Poribacteria bacterium]|nr:hypothetical protein [Candidatus Poribacteria bacterium]
MSNGSLTVSEAVFTKSSSKPIPKRSGVPCSEITAEWAAQRIKGLSLLTALKNALIGQNTREKGGVIKTLIDAFDYPRLGPGMMWETVAQTVERKGGVVYRGADVEKNLRRIGRSR